VQENRLFFFDSLGLRSGWRQDMQVAPIFEGLSFC
jgi:hypothetical protein